MKHLFLIIGLALTTEVVLAQDFRVIPKNYLTKPEDTEVWIPEVRVITPAGYGLPPSDAQVLFDGTNLDKWITAKDSSVAKWKIANGMATVVKGAGNISTKQNFGDCQLHIEWRSPIESDSLKGQQKGNSGVFFQGIYEVQVLNSYQNRTYSNGQAAALYKQTPPLVNATAKMGDWNTYDIVFIAPRFRSNGSLETPAYVTIFHNGIIVQNHTAYQGTTEYIGSPKNIAHGKGPISLQDHGNAVSFRNIWIREL